jgi:galactokinase
MLRRTVTAMPTLVEPGDPAGIAASLASALSRRTGELPTVVAGAPGRVNLVGEHLDYNGGRVLPLALPHATYAAVAPRTDRVLSVASLQLGEARSVALDDLAPGSVRGWAAYVAGVVWALGELGWSLPGLDVLVDSRVPVGAGLSSSAALECAVAVALLPLAGVADGPEVRRTLVEVCVRAETEMAGAPTGGMDQTVALFAAESQALLVDFADGSTREVPWRPEREELRLLVVDTRVSHALTSGEYAARRAECEAAARALGVDRLAQARSLAPDGIADPVLRRRVRHVRSESGRVDAAVAALHRGDHAALGPLLDASHESLREDFQVSCTELDEVVETCRRHGALGARMTGAGFGGSAVALVPAESVPDVTAAVAAAFARQGWDSPGFLLASAGPAARRLL